MARQLLECVPNFSEGRRTDVIEAILEPFRRIKGCGLLDHRADRDHNRLVVSLAGSPGPVQDALIQAAKIAVERIDMEGHQGGHPRIGAVDVIPFVPLQDMTMEDCVSLAREFGKRYHEETGIPVYYYEEAALNPDRRRLEVIRKGQYEGLKEEIGRPERHPDVGAPRLHPTAGATVIGARKPLVAFNVNLETRDLRIAKEIARAIRKSGGGLGHVKAIGLPVEGRNLVQVSLNLVDHEKNPLYRVLELIRMEARRWGVTVVETELCGMVPAEAMLESLAYYLQLTGFSARQVLQLRLLHSLLSEQDP